MKPILLLVLITLLSHFVYAQEMARIVRWKSPITNDFETLREDFNADAQLQSWGYQNKIYQFSAYKTRPNDPNATAVNRWVMPNCAASIVIAEHEIPDATLLSWGYKSKQFLFFAYRNKPATGDFVAVNRWINAKPQGDKCRDFTLTVAETEFTDAQLISYGYKDKKTQFWVPVVVNNFFSNQPLNPDFESGNLTNWAMVGNGFQIKKDDLPLQAANWGPRTMPLGGDYWQGLTPNFAWNNGRQGNWFAGSSQAATGSLLSSEFVPQKKFINFLVGGNAVNQADKNNLRVEVLVLNDGTFPASYQKSIIKGYTPGYLNKVTGKFIDALPLYELVSTSFQQVTVESKPYFLIEDLTVKGDVIQAADLFIRKSFDLSAIGQGANSRVGSSVRASLIGRKLRLRVVDETGNGYIYFDDVKTEDTEGTPVTAKAPRTPLWGFVDMHAHPMTHLAFGGKLIHGAPDIGSILPRDASCNHNVRAMGIAQALDNCNKTHGGRDLLDFDCRDDIRALVINGFEESRQANKQHGSNSKGFPYFTQWPKSNDLTHQQMWIDWVKRTYEGGLRVMVALATNNRTLGNSVAGPSDFQTDDFNSGNFQIEEIKKLVARHNGTRDPNDNWMEIAYSPSQLRQIVSSGRLALVLGIELDNLGNFNQNPNVNASDNSNQLVTNEIERLWALGIRYAFPIHVTDNKFGGTAAYEPVFNIANYVETGNFWALTPDNSLKTTINIDNAVKILAAAWVKMGVDPVRLVNTGKSAYLNLPRAHGYRNSLGLTNLGKFAINQMARKGFMIDIDHMSNVAVDDIQRLFENDYPLNSGHNGIRAENGATERQITKDQLKKVVDSGGFLGVGFSGKDNSSVTFANNFRQCLSVMNSTNIGLGTDINGLELQPIGRQNSRIYELSGLRPCKTGEKTWDYSTDGVAHYGLIPDFLQDLKQLGLGTGEFTPLFSGAEYFARMWERCEQQKTKVR